LGVGIDHGRVEHLLDLGDLLGAELREDGRKLNCQEEPCVRRAEPGRPLAAALRGTPLALDRGRPLGRDPCNGAVAGLPLEP
jgi:hypothetical protein